MEGTNTDFSDSFSLPPSCAVLTIIPKVIFVMIELLLLGILPFYFSNYNILSNMFQFLYLPHRLMIARPF